MAEFITGEGYALCLVANLYRCYQNNDSVLNYPASDMPLRVKFTEPTFAQECLLNAQCKVNRTLREYLVPVFQRIYLETCDSFDNFKSFLENVRFHQLIVGQPHDRSTPMKLLAHFALATELVLYCFQNNCYRLSNYLPKYLYTVLRTEEFGDVFSTLTEEGIFTVDRDKRPKVMSDSALRAALAMVCDENNGYKRFIRYCQQLQSTENHPSLAIFREIGSTFQEQQLGLLGPKPELGAGKHDGRSCNVCGGRECRSHLEVFMDKALKYSERSEDLEFYIQA